MRIRDFYLSVLLFKFKKLNKNSDERNSSKKLTILRNVLTDSITTDIYKSMFVWTDKLWIWETLYSTTYGTDFNEIFRT